MAMLLSKIRKFFNRDSRENIALRLSKTVLLLKCHDFSVEYGKEPLKVDINDMCDDLDKMGRGAMKEYVRKSLAAQVLALFKRIEENSDTFFSYHQRSKETAEIISEEVGYCPYISDSSVDPSGKGVFMQGRAGAGSIVAIFPGVVHLREYTGQKNYVEDNLLPDDHFFLMRRDDNVMIDARPHTLEANKIPYNPYGIGHMLNHGTSKDMTKPNSANVLQLNYDFPNDTLIESYRFPKKLRPFIPNIYAKPPSLFTSDRSAMMRTVLFIATRPIESGTELLVDYRLKGSEKFPLPEWYPQEDQIKVDEDDTSSPIEIEEKKKEGTDGALVDKYLG